MIHDVSEYITMNIQPPPFYIQDLLPMGGTLLLYGSPGVMKSWLAQHMAYCVATGTEWLGFPTIQARCLLVNFEISPATYHGRLVLMSRAFTIEPQMLYEKSPSILYLEEPGVFARFLEEVNTIDPDVIILDCWAACFGGDENSSREVSGFIRNMTELRGNNRSLILVHHSNKNILAVSPMDRARGHSKIAGWVDSIIYMVKQPTSKQLQFGKTRHATRELYSMNIHFSDYVWSTGRGQQNEVTVAE